MIFISLAKRGFGSVVELSQVEAEVILDILEFEDISNAIEKYEIDQARNNNGSRS